MTPEISPHPRLWERKNRALAGILAYLVPGLGHFYQGRWFKGAIYFFCILGTFFGGLKLGEGAVVYREERGGNGGGWNLTLATQSLTGAVVWPAFVQSARAQSPANVRITPDNLSEPVSFPFKGELRTFSSSGTSSPAEGTLTLTPGLGRVAEGTFRGTVDGKAVELPIDGRRFIIGRALSGGAGRYVQTSLDTPGGQDPRVLFGTTPRPLIDSFEAPPDQETLNEISGRLGAKYDLAIIFTLVAGLLNLFAIWDCVQGPAYGFGDEPPPEKKGKKLEKPPATATA